MARSTEIFTLFLVKTREVIRMALKTGKFNKTAPKITKIFGVRLISSLFSKEQGSSLIVRGELPAGIFTVGCEVRRS